MNHVRVWDAFVRLFHWSLVAAFAANALVIDDDTKLHQWVGYNVVGLVLARVLWGLVGTRYARFASFPPSLRGSLGQLREMASGHTAPHVGHTPLGALMIYNLLVTLLVIGLPDDHRHVLGHGMARGPARGCRRLGRDLGRAAHRGGGVRKPAHPRQPSAGDGHRLQGPAAQPELIPTKVP
jgi:hypothetical protein